MKNKHKGFVCCALRLRRYCGCRSIAFFVYCRYYNQQSMLHIESITQRSCKRWFNIQYPRFAPLLFAVPNGGRRGKIEARIMKAEGVVSGVADMILLVPRGGFASLCIEFKSDKGRQSTMQKAWQQAAEEAGNKYIVVRSIEEFIDAVNEYLSTPARRYPESLS